MESPFNMIIVGMTNCGKTFYLLNMLENEYKNHFDFWNKTYQEWRYIDDEDVIPIECDHDNVDKFLHIIPRSTKGQTL